MYKTVGYTRNFVLHRSLIVVATTTILVITRHTDNTASLFLSEGAPKLCELRPKRLASTSVGTNVPYLNLGF